MCLLIASYPGYRQHDKLFTLSSNYGWLKSTEK